MQPPNQLTWRSPGTAAGLLSIIVPWTVVLVCSRTHPVHPLAFPGLTAITIAALGCICGRSVLREVGRCFLSRGRGPD